MKILGSDYFPDSTDRYREIKRLIFEYRQLRIAAKKGGHISFALGITNGRDGINKLNDRRQANIPAKIQGLNPVENLDRRKAFLPNLISSLR